MSNIIPHLWFDTEAAEAAEFYLSVFPDATKRSQTVIKDTPSGDCDFLHIELFGQEFMLISAGPYFTVNDSISFLIDCESDQEAFELYTKLLDDPEPLRMIDEIDFSEIQWINDRYGISWMIQCSSTNPKRRISPVLQFVGSLCGKMEEAVDFYVSTFNDASIVSTTYTVNDGGIGESIFHEIIAFTLEGRSFFAMEKFTVDEMPFNEAVSLLIECETQKEIDKYWTSLSAVPEAEQCGWLKDKYGLSWQVSPRIMNEMMLDDNDERLNAVTQSILQMKKLDMDELQRVYDSF